ncbi:MAG: glycosyltransferase [Lentisphaerae bacterium]|nr:glycosyltransferase [Lentisphaerota bacterium]
MPITELVSRRASVVVTTYNAPDTLALVLLALSRQEVLPAEVIVADDGSDERTARRLEDTASECPFRLVHVHQPDKGFRAARSRNNAIHVAREDVMAFLDQDTLPHRDWLKVHLEGLAPGQVCLGHVLDLADGAVADATRADAVVKGTFERLHDGAEFAELAALQRKYAMYAGLRRWGVGIAAKPKLRSCNFSAFREDLARVNGFDEEYVGWGQEDDDLGRRLYRAGIRPVVLVASARVTHLPHPLRHPGKWKEGANVSRFSPRNAVARCAAGLDAHPHVDVRFTELKPVSPVA